MAVRGTGLKTLGRKTDQRAALVRGLTRSLILDGQITTTRAKAQTVRPFVEKLATKAKDPTLHNRRQIIQALNDVSATDRLIERLEGSKRPSGHFRTKRAERRQGDGAQLVTMSFVDEHKPAAPAKKAEAPKKKAEKQAKKSEDKK